MEVAAEVLLVGQPGHPDDHRVPVRPGREERHRGRLAAQLVLGVVQVGQVLDLGNGEQPVQPGAEREPEDRRLVEQGVEDPLAAEPLVQPLGDAVHAALAGHVLAEDPHAGHGPPDRR